MLTHAELHRRGADLIVEWVGDEDVVITVGPSPDEAGPLRIDASTPHRVTFPDPDPEVRHYARIEAGDGAAIVVAERLVPFDGTVNFRDLGGYPTRDGRRVRWGRVFRSDALHDLSENDLALLGRLGVRHVCDLRREPEADVAPDRVPEGVCVESLPIGGLAAETAGMSARMMRGEIPEVSVGAMAEVYATILRYHPESFGTVVRRAARTATEPMLVHCTAGKDRTGTASALLLSLVGVEDEQVAEDYELSHRYYSQQKIDEVRPGLEAAGVEFAKVEVYFGAPRAVMLETLEDLRSTYGSVEEYLTGPAGLDDATIRAVCDALVA